MTLGLAVLIGVAAAWLGILLYGLGRYRAREQFVKLTEERLAMLNDAQQRRHS